MSTSRIKKIPYKIEGERPVDDQDCPRIKSRRLDLESCHFVDLISVTIRLSCSAVLYYIRVGKFYHQKISRIRLKNNNGILLFDHKVLSNDTIPKEYKLFHTQDGENIVSFELHLEYKKRVDVWSGMPTVILFDSVDLDFFGIDDGDIIRRAEERMSATRKRWAWNLCFSHLIHFGHTDIVSILERREGIRHVHPLIDKLCRLLYFEADYNGIEMLMKSAAKCGALDEYINGLGQRIVWSRFKSSVLPSERVNPQMCMDEKNQLIYLFGGASQESRRNDYVLDDFWRFDILSKRWKSLSMSSYLNGGPCGRTKGIMFFDAERRMIYVCGGLGCNARVLDDLYQYDVHQKKWKKITSRICYDTCNLIHTYAVAHGPKSGDLTVYCFPWNQSSSHFRHFRVNSDALKLDKSIFAFNILTRERRCLLIDGTGLTYSYAIFNPRNRSFYLFGRESNGEVNLSSCYKCLYEYDIQDERCNFIADLPFSGRIDCCVEAENGNLYVCAFSDPSNCLPGVWSNQFWKFSYQDRKWVCLGLLEAKSGFPKYVPSDDEVVVDILPRKDAGFVFDNINRVFYMFGGVLSHEIINTPLLNDLCAGKLEKVEKEEVLQKCVWHIRLNRFVDALMSKNDWQLKALSVLQQINSEFPQAYQKQANQLAQLLFRRELVMMDGEVGRKSRLKKLFAFLCSHLPPSIQPPKDNLMNIVSRVVSPFSDSLSTSTLSTADGHSACNIEIEQNQIFKRSKPSYFSS